jgi:1,4-dihydroxy-2-naphthoate octaprenyltransferase
MTTVQAYLGVARGPFLLLPVTLVAAGAAAAAWAGAFSWTRTLIALVGLVALHMAVNILNEWSDYRRGIDLETVRTPFSGGSGTLPAGAMEARTALVAGLANAAVGLVIGVWFLVVVGPVMLPILALGAVSVLLYTDVLARAGVGEFFAGLGLGALPVAGTAIVQEGWLPAAGVAAAFPAFCMTFNLLLLNEFPDEVADRRGGRRNLVLLLGRRGAAWVYVVAALAVPASLVVSVIAGWLPWAALAAVAPSLLLVKPVGWALGSPEAPVPLPAMGANVTWNLATNTVLAVGLVLARWV